MAVLAQENLPTVMLIVAVVSFIILLIIDRTMGR